ncbi:AbrB/MazE/SpoVT family DNA-binding domain-containing protein [Deinococcus sp. YIM 134068]|uniref:AbrB/MazE/SpoVT family DNA-binding domain-containing protein n=1 Tax=Deinococcus lichenicola TaxID=3118910 RepID=UPI002F9583A2
MNRIVRSTITSKGQITLPKAIRDHLRVSGGEQIEFVVDGETVTVRSVTPSQNPFAAWLGVAPLPDGQTVAGLIREMRDGEDGPDPAREGGPGARVVHLHFGEPIPRN